MNKTNNQHQDKWLYDPDPGSVHILDLVAMVQDGVYAQDRLSDHLIGMLILGRLIHDVTSWQVELFTTSMIKGSSKRNNMGSAGRPFLGPDGKVIVFYSDALHGDKRVHEYEISDLDLDGILGHPEYQSWLSETLYAGGSREKRTYARTRPELRVWAECSKFMGGRPYRHGPKSIKPADFTVVSSSKIGTKAQAPDRPTRKRHSESIKVETLDFATPKRLKASGGSPEVITDPFSYYDTRYFLLCVQVDSGISSSDRTFPRPGSENPTSKISPPDIDYGERLKSVRDLLPDDYQHMGYCQTLYMHIKAVEMLYASLMGCDVDLRVDALDRVEQSVLHIVRGMFPPPEEHLHDLYTKLGWLRPCRKVAAAESNSDSSKPPTIESARVRPMKQDSRRAKPAPHSSGGIPSSPSVQLSNPTRRRSWSEYKDMGRATESPSSRQHSRKSSQNANLNSASLFSAMCDTSDFLTNEEMKQLSQATRGPAATSGPSNYVISSSSEYSFDEGSELEPLRPSLAQSKGSQIVEGSSTYQTARKAPASSVPVNETPNNAEQDKETPVNETPNNAEQDKETPVNETLNNTEQDKETPVNETLNNTEQDKETPVNETLNSTEQGDETLKNVEQDDETPNKETLNNETPNKKRKRGAAARNSGGRFAKKVLSAEKISAEDE